MSSVNKVILVGNLGADPEVRTSQGGTRFASFSVATSDRWKDRASGEKKERTEWHRVVIVSGGEGGGLVGVAEKYLRKGRKVYLEGELRTRKWQAQDGSDRWSTEVVLSGPRAVMTPLDKAEGGGARDYSGYADAGGGFGSGGSGGSGSDGWGGGDLDDEVPF